MKRNSQLAVSLVSLFLGALVLAFSTARFFAWSESDARYKAFIDDLDKDGELSFYFNHKGQHDYYIKHILTFRPSGRMYSGSNDSALPIVGGGVVALLGLAGLLDSFRRGKETSLHQVCPAGQE